MLSPFPLSQMKIHSASNSVTDNDSADLFVPVKEVSQTLSLFSIVPRAPDRSDTRTHMKKEFVLLPFVGGLANALKSLGSTKSSGGTMKVVRTVAE